MNASDTNIPPKVSVALSGPETTSKRAIANASDLKIVLYNIPGRTGVTMAPATVARLAEHPNIVAVKEATGSMDIASEIARLCDITILSGDDSMTLPLASVGGKGVGGGGCGCN